MKRNIINHGATLKSISVFLVSLVLVSIQAAIGQVCSNPSGVMYGLTGTGNIHPVTLSTGATAAQINPAHTGNAPDLSNAMGYNSLNGRFYFFKRNVMNAPQEFVAYDPALNSIIPRTASPVTTIINLGCINPNGSGYYCIDALGRLYYYRVNFNSWTTICTNIRDQFGTTLSYIISGGAMPTATSRIYGDMAFDGSGNLWILISGPTDYGIYKVSAPMPISTVSSLTITQVRAPNTPSPGLQSIGGVAFNTTGQMVIATNAGDNRLYRLENNLSLTYLSTMAVDGVGTDLTSCNYPLWVLAESWKQVNATVKSGNDVQLNWTVEEKNNTNGYVIEHSSDGENWSEAGTVQSKRTTGESSYMFVHRNAAGAKNYYRIAQMNADESKSYSQVKTVQLNTGGRLSISVWPNPSTETLQIEINEGDMDANTRIFIYDQWGRQIKGVPVQEGVNKIDVKSLPTGTYVVRLEEPGGRFVNQKFVKN